MFSARPQRRIGYLDVSPLGRIQRFLLIQLQLKHHRLDVLTTHVTVCVSYAELKTTYLFTCLRLGVKRPGGEVTKGRNVHKSSIDFAS